MSKAEQNTDIVGLDLISQIELIEQQTLFNSQTLKYSEASIKELKLILSSRNYVNITWELAHLYWVLVHTNGNSNALKFFFVDEAVFAQSAKSWFEGSTFINLDTHRISVVLQGIEVNIRDHVFIVNWSRMNVISGLMEVLVMLIPDLLEQDKELVGKGLNSIKILASDLQKSLYEWSETCMPSVRSHKKFVALSQTFGNGDIRQIDSAFVSSWKQLSNIEGFAKIVNFFSSLCSFLASKDAIDRVESLSEQNENAVSSEQSIYDFVSEYSEQNLLLKLPPTPKVLSQNQLKKLNTIFEDARYARKLPWSVLAVMAFNHAQAQLVQAVRSNASDKHKRDVIQHTEHYSEQLSFLAGTASINQQTMLTCLALMKNSQSAYLIEAVTANSQWLSLMSPNAVISKSHIKDDIESQSTVKNPAETFTPDRLYQAAPELFERATKASKKVKRQGLTEATKLDDKVYVSLIKILVNINDVIESIQKFDASKESIDAKYRSDCSIVINEFSQRYIDI